MVVPGAAAHSVVRVLDGAYNRKLYQVRRSEMPIVISNDRRFVVSIVPVRDLFPTEEVLPWRLVAADVFVVGVVALLSFWVFRWMASRWKVGKGPRKWILRHAWIALASSVLALRGFYGPPIRLLLTAKYDRCRQRLADRLASSPEARAWKALHTIEWLLKGVPEAKIPRFLARDLLALGEDGIQRLGDKHLLFRMEAIAQGFANSEKNGCDSDGWSFVDVLWRVNPQAREVWFNMIFDAITAEIVESPPVQDVSEKERTEILATLSSARRQPTFRDDESPRQLRCREVEQLYAMANALKGARRVAAARLLAEEPLGRIGDF